MKYYIFKMTNGRETAVTNDRMGRGLPRRQSGDWAYFKELSIESSSGQRVGAGYRDIVESVNRDGYFVWPQRKTVPKVAATHP